ncbi:hypothetical protein PVAP13_1NG458638 [Panicum virgatum]|uniref:Uncharacterized protein n=1 Tax=Panicum virgatum TaxID=38727 RepID=A0A8T0XDJ7_PANVG|nr:hypothetical protein PVAP13_1NG458638 [Panicum virgatum]KAG2653480.1 hypothetical protein PVAP13_1NG458638 [Panicum virgatum]
MQDFEVYCEAHLGVHREPSDDGDDWPPPRGSDHLDPAARTSPSSSSSSGWCWRGRWRRGAEGRGWAASGGGAESGGWSASGGGAEADGEAEAGG